MASQMGRNGLEIKFEFESGQTDSDPVDIQQGCFGTLIVPVGSSLIGKALQIVAVSSQSPAKFTAVELLSSAITLVAGANPLSADAIREAGAASRIMLRVDSAVASDSECVLLWKS